MPEGSLSEYHLSTPVGIPLEELSAIPGVAVPKDGYLVPSDAPGFGQEILEEWIRVWDHADGHAIGKDVVL